MDGSGEWRPINGKQLKRVTASSPDSIYAVDADDYVYSCREPYIGEYMLLDGKLAQLDDAFDSFAGVDSANSVFCQGGLMANTAGR